MRRQSRRSQSNRGRMAGVLAVVVLVGCGCTSTVAGTPTGADIGPVTAAEGTAQALANLAEAGAVRYTGSLLAANGAKAAVDLTAMGTGEVVGSVKIDGFGASIVVLNNILYLKADGAFWSGMAPRFGVTDGDGGALANRWVKLPTSLIGIEFGEVFVPEVVRRTAGGPPERTGDVELAGSPTTTVAGVAAYAVDVDGGTVHLATQPPYGVLRVELDRIGSEDGTSVTDAVLDVADSSARTMPLYQDLAGVASTELVTAVDALTGIEQGEHRFESCGASSCTLSVDIKNTGDTPVRVHLKADWNGDDAPLGSCENQAGPVAPGAGSTIGCTIDSPEWVNFYQRANSVPGTHPYGAQWSALVLADPPDVANLKAWSVAKAPTTDATRTEGSHAVYQLTSAGTVWKYGVVTSQHWHDHAANQLRGCVAATSSTCRPALVTTADNAASAHALATQLVAAYRAEHDACPAGQWVGCGPGQT